MSAAAAASDAIHDSELVQGSPPAMNDTQAVVSSGTLFIDGAWTRGTATFPVIDKFSGGVVGTAERASKEQVDRAVAAARRSFETVQLEPYDRYRILMKAAQLIEERRDRSWIRSSPKPAFRSRTPATKSADPRRRSSSRRKKASD